MEILCTSMDEPEFANDAPYNAREEHDRHFGNPPVSDRHMYPRRMSCRGPVPSSVDPGKWKPQERRGHPMPFGDAMGHAAGRVGSTTPFADPRAHR